MRASILTRLPIRLSLTDSVTLRVFNCCQLPTYRYSTCGINVDNRWKCRPLIIQNNSKNSLELKCLYSNSVKGNIGDANKSSTIICHGKIEKDAKNKDVEDVDPSKLGLFARFKLMYKQYWYVLLPVHVITSIGWLGGFYYLSKSGVDIPAVLESIKVSETIIEKLQDSKMGHVAIAYLCYKVATPLRYMVTLGGTTVSIKYLEQAGYIKPMPTKKQLMQMYEDKKADRAKRKQEK